MMNHTPGPWESLDDCVRARIIAQAPEMFQALVQAYEIIDAAFWGLDPFENMRFKARAEAIFGKLMGCRMKCLESPEYKEEEVVHG